MYFVYFRTFSYKFKVQRTPTEFGLPVVLLYFGGFPADLLDSPSDVLSE